MLQISNLGKTYKVKSAFKTNTVKALQNITFELPTNSSLAIVGESGSGKTTLARLLIGIEKPSTGSFQFTQNPKIAMVFQDIHGSFNPYHKIKQLIVEPLLISRIEPNLDEIAALLHELDLTIDILEKRIHELSGGQRQRVGIARALITQSNLLILDEPVSALDVSVQAKLITLLRNLRKKRGIQFIVISHDLHILKPLSDYTAVLLKGRLVEFAKTELIFEKAKHEYTRSLLSAVPGRKAD